MPEETSEGSEESKEKSNRSGKSKRPATKKTWDKSLQNRVKVLDKSTKDLSKKVDEFIDIIEDRTDTAHGESVGHVSELKEHIEMTVDDI